MANSTRNVESKIEVIGDIVRNCRSFSKRCPEAIQQITKMMNDLRTTHFRMAVVGAQGVGKSTVARALLASPHWPEPPIPVAEGEETRIPIIVRYAKTAAYEQVFKRKPKRVEGRISEKEVRRRASADQKVYRRNLFERLQALIIEDPRCQMPPNTELADLPGVSGNLAVVSEWAADNILKPAQLLVFVLASSQTITCTEDEANLIRSFGPLMVHPVFVQNVWSEFDDDIERTATDNKRFLDKHIGQERYSYLFLDASKALREAERGPSQALQPLKNLVTPFLEREPAQLLSSLVLQVIEKANLALQLASIEYAEATGKAAEAREQLENVEREQRQLERLQQRLFERLSTERVTAARALGQAFSNGLMELRTKIESFLEGDRTINQKLIEQEAARQMGQLNREMQKELHVELGKLTDIFEEEMDAEFPRKKAKFNAKFKAPGLDLVGLRMTARAATNMGSIIAGGAGGVKTGAAVGTAVGGPIGFLAGTAAGFAAGLLVGWLTKKTIETVAEKPLVQKQIDGYRVGLTKELDKARKESQKKLATVVDEHVEILMAHVTRLTEERKDALKRRLPFGKATTALPDLEAEVNQYEAALRELRAFVQEVELA